MRPISLACLTVVLILTGACSAVRESLDFDLASQPVYYQDAVVKRGTPQISVNPTTPPNRELTAIMVPFRITQEISNAKATGREISRQFWQAWLGEQVFPVIEYAENAPPYRADLAQYLGNSKKAELAIGGQITNYYSGGAAGTSSLSVTVEIWDLQSGNLLWLITHSGLLDPTGYKDYLVLSTRRRVPADPMWLIIQTVAKDIARAFKGWSNPYSVDDTETRGSGERTRSEPSAFGSGRPSAPNR